MLFLPAAAIWLRGGGKQLLDWMRAGMWRSHSSLSC